MKIAFPQTVYGRAAYISYLDPAFLFSQPIENIFCKSKVKSEADWSFELFSKQTSSRPAAAITALILLGTCGAGLGWDSADVSDGYRDIQLSVLYSDENDLRIIGEIQVHDAQLHQLKRKVRGPKDLCPAVMCLTFSFIKSPFHSCWAVFLVLWGLYQFPSGPAAVVTCLTINQRIGPSVQDHPFWASSPRTPHPFVPVWISLVKPKYVSGNTGVFSVESGLLQPLRLHFQSVIAVACHAEPSLKLAGPADAHALQGPPGPGGPGDMSEQTKWGPLVLAPATLDWLGCYGLGRLLLCSPWQGSSALRCLITRKLFADCPAGRNLGRRNMQFLFEYSGHCPRSVCELDGWIGRKVCGAPLQVNCMRAIVLHTQPSDRTKPGAGPIHPAWHPLRFR